MFYFNRREKDGAPVKWGLTGGLGYDLSDITVLGGIHITYYENITFNFGLAGKKTQLLRGMYSENDIISTNLETDQLHDKYFRINPFFGISFRLDKPIRQWVGWKPYSLKFL